MQTGTFTVNVDNPEKVRITLPQTGQYIDPVQGANILKFIPGADISVSLANKQAYNVPFYKVTKTEGTTTTEIPFTNNSYDLMIAQGMVVDVLADYPADLNYSVSFTFTNPGTEPFLTSCTVGGEPVENFRQGFTAHAGEKVVINRDNNLYKVNSLTLNGENQSSYYSTIEFTLTGETAIVADVEKYATYSVKVNVNDPTGVGVYTSYVNDATRIPVVAGENTIEVPENNNRLCFKPLKGYQFDSCTINGSDMDYDQYSKYYYANITADGNVINITSSPIVYNDFFVVYVNDINALYSPESTLYNSGYEYFALNQGYNKYPFLPSEAPFAFGAYSESECFGYKNNELFEANYSQYRFTPVNGDVFKFYFGEEPTLCTVNFTIEEDAARTAVTGKYDIIKDLDFTQPLTALSGTGIDIYGNNLGVTVDGTDVPCIDNIYSFTVTGNNNVVITNKQVGIEGINADQKANNVYNLQGILMIRNASEAQIQALPAGMYIINGKKIIKK